MVESALILPVVMFIIFAIIEGSLMVAGISSASYWTNRAAQGVADAGVDPVRGDAAAIAAVHKSLLATTQLFVVDEIDIVEAGPDGQPAGGTTRFMDRYDLNGTPLPLPPPSGGVSSQPWVRRDASPANAQYAAVVVKYHYRYRAGILGRQLDLTSTGVARLQPQSSPQPLLDQAPPVALADAAVAPLRHSTCQGHNGSATLVGFVYVVPNPDARGGFFIHVNVRKSEFDPNDPSTDRIRSQHYNVYIYPAGGVPPTGCGPGNPNPVLAGTSTDAVVDTDADGNGDAQVLIPRAQLIQFPGVFAAPSTFTVELGAPTTKRLRFDALVDEITSDVVRAPA